MKKHEKPPAPGQRSAIDSDASGSTGPDEGRDPDLGRGPDDARGFGDRHDADEGSAASATLTPAGTESDASPLDVQLAEQRDRFLRLAAEYDNFRKRSARDRQKAELEGMSIVVQGILEALDDLGRFAHIDPETTDTVTLRQGVAMVEKKLLKSLSGHGLEIVNPLGEPFDPAVQEALVTVPAERPEDDHLVAQVYQVGYVLNGRLLRAARVVVKQWTDVGRGDAPSN